MSARGMFDDLGYEKSCINNCIDYSIYNFNCCATKTVSFDLKNKTVECSVFGDSMEVDMPLLKAITQQCKELGWLE